MRIALVSDAWAPQVNGVVRTLTALIGELGGRGHQVTTITPDLFRTVPCPTYPEIRLALRPAGRIARLLDAAQPDAIHISTEGPLGFAARRHCLRRGWGFTTAFHTRFPEYVAARFAVPAAWSYALMRRFHARSKGVMVATETVRRELALRGFRRLTSWNRGVDAELYQPARRDDFLGLPRPIFLSVGRVAVEKNFAAFLALDLPGSKVVVGDGPMLDKLHRQYPETHFLGRQVGTDLARLYASVDVFVFPSRTDTFGLVLLEALASGVPVAAYPVPGPLDVVADSGAGVLDEDLGRAALAALDIPRERCRAHALRFTWAASADQFVDNLWPLDGPRSAGLTAA
ncbi:MAG TPA: glycosyltransferase family 1 protein [Stellaceae bacterium]|nr:glycosyltransferase family 1 protein [Stellaceae bacterium]